MWVHVLRNLAICSLLGACSVGPAREANQESSEAEDGGRDDFPRDASKDAPRDVSKDASNDALPDAREEPTGGDACVKAEEVCNGLDDDCDQNVDEALGMQTCGKGACKIEVPACESGALANCQPGEPAEESCNGLDDDCDGQTDEGQLDPGDDCLSEEPGVCAAGTRRCIGGSVQCISNTSPTSETCNGLDDDCNGLDDDGNPGAGASCNTGKHGICAAGTTVCSAGKITCAQDQQASSDEMCGNGVDDDCNGVVDDGCCAPGMKDCNGAGGCECIGTACCGTGCQSAHQNGVGNYFFDCEPLGTHTITQAAAACLAFTGDISECFNHGAACDSGTTSAVCSSGHSQCACWTYAGANKGRVFLNTGSSSCLCPLTDDPIWN